MINENDMNMDPFDVNMKVSKIIAKFASNAKKHNAADCIKTLVGNIYKSCAGSKTNLKVVSLLGGADYISSFLIISIKHLIDFNLSNSLLPDLLPLSIYGVQMTDMSICAS